MVIDFSNIDLHERPTLILKNAGDIPLGVLGFAYNVELECNYNEISVLHFTMPSKVDNEDVPCYEDLVGMRIIEIPGIGCFTLISPDEINDGVRKYKECKAYSLEYEFSYKKISMAKDTYKFWDNNPAKRNGTILGMIMESMPSWSVSSVSDNLINKYRTFEVDNENLYQFIKDTIQQSYGCIFDFDTLNRTVIIHDVDVEVSDTQVYLSLQNLVKEIEIHEDIENMVTRLDVSGADGVNIRDVNPTGTNSIINLDYYMDTKNFSQQLIDKYYAWKTLCADSGPIYYAKSINHSLTIMRLNTERAAMTDLDGELMSLDNQRAVVIQSISQGIMTQADLDAINIQYAAKQSEIYVKNNLISELESEQTREMQEIRAIVDACSFDKYFTNDEHRQLDRYIRDGEISESSFVSSTSVYTDEGTSKQLTGALLSITDASIEQTTSSDKTIFDCRGGTLSVAGFGAAELIYGVLSNGADNVFIFTAALSSGTLSGASFQSGSLTITGSISGSISSSTQDINVTVSGYAYFTLNPSEYQRRSIAWDLYEYGQIMSVKLSQPTYSFSISSANFLALEEFRAFKNQLGLGKKIYLDNDGDILKPICIGANFSFEDLTMLELKFGDSYVRTDTEFKLADILEQSTSTGRTVETGKFNFEEFTQSGASTGIREYMRSAIDLAKNRIIESSGQAISMDRAGLRLRKWKNESDQTFDDEQIWLNNNSVLMTDDNWKTAKMAIGKFKDPNFNEDMWGILAPMVVGTLLAGESLVIESAKTDGSSGMSVFRVDGDGCRMYNGDISVIGENGTLWTYVLASDTNVYSQMSTDSSVVTTISAAGTVVVTKRATASGVTWGYTMTSNGYAGWIQLTGATLKSTETGCSHIVLHPDVGIVVGKYPAINSDGSGRYSVNPTNARLWIDLLGNIHISGYATFSDVTTITNDTIKTTNVTASNLKVNAANITGTLTIGQLPGTVAETSDIPTKVSQLNNDSGFQNATQVTTITNDTIKTTNVTASNLKVNAANITGTLTIGQLPGTVAETSDIPTKVSQLNNDSGFQNATQVTTITNDTIKTTNVTASNLKVNAANITGTLTIGQLPGTVAETSDIPTKVSQLNNDSGFQNATQVTTITNDTIRTTDIIATNLKVKAANIQDTLSANKIYGGTLNLGGNNNQNGEIKIYDSDSQLVGSWNNSGITINKGNINIGNGSFTVNTTGEMYCSNATINGSITSAYSDGTKVLHISDGMIYGNSTSKYIDFRGIGGDGNPYIYSGALYLDVYKLYIRGANAGELLEGITNTIEVVTNVKMNSDGSITQTKTKYKFRKGIYVGT